LSLDDALAQLGVSGCAHSVLKLHRLEPLAIPVTVDPTWITGVVVAVALFGVISPALIQIVTGVLSTLAGEAMTP
jgi:hypothetical protein